MKRTIAFILVCVSAFQIYAQQTISGNIKASSENNSIVGASITVERLKLGTISDSRGHYELNLPGDGPWKINFRHIAYENTSITINSKSAINRDVFMILKPYSINPVIVTADRIKKALEDVPARMDVINTSVIASSAANNADDLLKSIPGIFVNRSWGIYSKNASVTMRGFSSSARVLVLLDDVPLNKSGGGGVNWNLLPNSSLDKIEVMKGPSSSIYGNNAMTGAINLITRNAGEKASADLELFAAENNTYGFSLRASTANKIKKPVFWISLSAMQGDGYYLDPLDERNEYSSKAFIKQINAYLKSSYAFSENERIEMTFLGSLFKCGLGTQVYEEEGKYDEYKTWMGSARYYLNKAKASYKIISFLNYEDYFNQNESVNSYGDYRLIYNPTKKIDAGLWTTAKYNFDNGSELLTGIDYKFAIEDGENLYLTASDEIYFYGMHNFAAVFTQYSKKFGENNILQLGLRYDFGQYSNGEIYVVNPTTNSDFLIPYLGNHDSNNWNSLSPKIAFKHIFSDKFNVYTSISKGFMPPSIDDMTRSGKIRKGIKIANPFLLPEVLYNLEGGMQWKVKKFTIEPSIYYSIAENMIYQVWTGDSVDIFNSDPQPMIQKRNVSKGTVIGAELSVKYQAEKWLTCQIGYSFNESKIKEHQAEEGDDDLTGLYMAEVPKHLFFSDARFRYKNFRFTIEYRYTDHMFSDDLNLLTIDAYNVVNLYLGADFKNFGIALSVNDLFDEEFIDRKGYLSPGRFFMVKLKYTLK